MIARETVAVGGWPSLEAWRKARMVGLSRGLIGDGRNRDMLEDYLMGSHPVADSRLTACGVRLAPPIPAVDRLLLRQLPISETISGVW